MHAENKLNKQTSECFLQKQVKGPRSLHNHNHIPNHNHNLDHNLDLRQHKIHQMSFLDSIVIDAPPNLEIYLGLG